MPSTMYYSGLRLDRAAAAREDPEWVAEVLGQDSTRVIPLWRDKCLVRDGLPVTTRRGDAEGLFDDGGGAVEAVGFGNGLLQAASGLPVAFLLEDGLHGSAKPGCREFLPGDDDAGSAGRHARGDAGLVVAQG